MNASQQRRLKGCAMGCGAVLLVALVAFGGTVWQLDRLGRRAHAARQRLDADCGPRQEYSPGAGPLLEPAAMRRFLAVRRQLHARCPEFGANQGELTGLARFDGRDDVPRGELLAQAWRTARSSLAVARDLGDFAVARNEALLAEGMGLGEYTWTYVLAFYSGLGLEPVLGLSEHDPGRLSPGVSALMADLMERRSTALHGAAATIADGNPLKARMTAEARRWRAEAEIQRRNPGRTPFVGEAPAFLTEVLAPYRDELGGLYCPHTDALELLDMKFRGLGYADR